MTQIQIPPPHGLGLQPDKATAKGISDYTGHTANHRVLHINLGLFKYGTNDKTHAAALLFSLILLIIIVALIVAGIYSAKDGMPWVEKTFSWVSSAFLFVSGVALGKGATSDGNAEREKSE